MERAVLLGTGRAILAGCSAATSSARPADISPPPVALASAAPAPFASTYQPRAAPDTAIVGASILTGIGTRIENGNVLMAEGKIVPVGPDVPVPTRSRINHGPGQWGTPGH